MPDKVKIIYLSLFFPLPFESLPFRGSDRPQLELWSQARDRCPQAPRKGVTMVWPQKSWEYYVKRAKSTPGGEGSCVCFRLLTHGNCTGKNAKSLGSGDDFRLRCWQCQSLIHQVDFVLESTFVYSGSIKTWGLGTPYFIQFYLSPSSNFEMFVKITVFIVVCSLQCKQKLAWLRGVFGINTASLYVKTQQTSLALFIPNFPGNHAISFYK